MNRTDDWPPKPQNIALAQQSLWSAWWVGDADGLRSAYAATGSAGGYEAQTKEHSFEPLTSRQGGLIPTIARLFWGRPSVGSGRKAGLHVPIPADIATASADLLFSEPPQFVLEGEDNLRKSMGENYVPSKSQARIDEVLNDGGFHSTLIEAGEVSSALGGGWLRLVWDTEIEQHVMVEAVAADSAFGEWRWGKLMAVTFFTEFKDKATDQEVIRHLERHESGAVIHSLYRGQVDKLGPAVDLASHPDTAGIAEMVGKDGVTLDEATRQVTIPTGIKGLTAAYVANMRPQRRWRKLPGICELGRSDFDGVEPLFDALDETYTSWMRDVRLAKSRILVPEFMLTNMGKGGGSAWDEDQEVYAALNVAPDKSANQITAQQFAIRVAEHADTADALIDQILDAAGYSPSTFGRGTEGMATATEVVSKERKSDRTRDKKCRYWSQTLDPLLSTWLELDALVFKTGASGQVETKWADTTQADPLQLAQTASALRVAEAASTKTLVAMQHADWDEAEIDAEVALILDESGRSVPEPLPFAGEHTDENVPPEGTEPE
ncbi:MAG: phage portal protein [Phycisphaerales bacterium]